MMYNICMKNYIVYCHTNKINGKKYVGITSQKPQSRWKNGNGYRNNEYFFRAIQKYGWHNFQHEILYTNLTKADAEKKEVELIAEYHSSLPENGYNIELGGNSTGKIADSTRIKISKALMGHECSDATKQKISRSNTGKANPMKGKKMTAEQVEKNRLSHLGQKSWISGRHWSAEERAKCNGKAVVCVETGEVFRTAHEAGREKHLDFSSICKCCKGKAKTVGGFRWRYAEEWELTS